MPCESTGYTGRDNLEVMQEAENYNRWLCNLVISRAHRGRPMLDFGAGSGTFAKALASEGFDVACVENDQVLRQMLTAAGLNAFPSIASVPANSVDFIYTLNVLEHIEDDSHILMELTRRLRKGGTLLVYVPAFQILFSSMDEKVGHYRRYRLPRLVRMIRSSGLQVTYARYGDSLGFLATIAYKIIGARDGSINPASIRLYDRVAFPVSKILDHLTGFFFGKNIIVVATKH